MSLIWTICGAGRGVGKTTLAMQLSEVLPDSTYTKCGHGKIKSDKPGKFFKKLVTDNLVFNKYIQQSGKKFGILNTSFKSDLKNSIIDCINKDHEPDDKFTKFLMLACLRRVNWKLLPYAIDTKDENIKEKLIDFQEMLFKDTAGFYVAMQVPKTTYRIGGSIKYRF